MPDSLKAKRQVVKAFVERGPPPFRRERGRSRPSGPVAASHPRLRSGRVVPTPGHRDHRLGRPVHLVAPGGLRPQHRPEVARMSKPRRRPTSTSGEPDPTHHPPRRAAARGRRRGARTSPGRTARTGRHHLGRRRRRTQPGDRLLRLAAGRGEPTTRCTQALGEHRIRLQAVIANQVRARKTPILEFRPDNVLRSAERIDQILRENPLPERPRHADDRDRRVDADGDGEA